MSVRTALVGAATTVILVAGLGSPPAQDAAREADASVLLHTVTVIPSWDVADAPGDVIGGVAIRLGTLVVLAALLSGLAGRRGARGPAVLAGWAALLVAAAVANVAAFVYTAAVVLDGDVPGRYMDNLVAAANTGAAFALWTGWLVGLAVALATPAYRPTAETEGWTPIASPRISDPPPPWWAPTTTAGPGGEAIVRPGPSVFEPDRARPREPMRPVVAGIDDPDTHMMTTVSGDPHPSDPDATQAVGMPPVERTTDAPTEAVEAAAGGPADTDKATATAPPAVGADSVAPAAAGSAPTAAATAAGTEAPAPAQPVPAETPDADATSVLPPDADATSVLPADDGPDATDVMPRAPD